MVVPESLSRKQIKTLKGNLYFILWLPVFVLSGEGEKERGIETVEEPQETGDHR